MNGRPTLNVVMSECHVRRVEIASVPARQAFDDIETASVNKGHTRLPAASYHGRASALANRECRRFFFCAAALSHLRLNGYYDFPLRMSFCQITESFGTLAQRVTSIDDRHNFTGFQEIFQKS